MENVSLVMKRNQLPAGDNYNAHSVGALYYLECSPIRQTRVHQVHRETRLVYLRNTEVLMNWKSSL